MSNIDTLAVIALVGAIIFIVLQHLALRRAERNVVGLALGYLELVVDGNDIHFIPTGKGDQ